jgi:hypothetical protein
MNKLPYKLRIFEWAAKKNSPFTVEDVMTALKPEYGTEQQFTLKRTEEYVQSLLGACMINAVETDLDENDELKVVYEVTEFGFSRMKHIPNH